LWLIKVWFSASTFVVKIATFAKPETVMCNFTKDIAVKNGLTNPKSDKLNTDTK
jgi:hypothetical protein